MMPLSDEVELGPDPEDLISAGMPLPTAEGQLFTFHEEPAGRGDSPPLAHLDWGEYALGYKEAADSLAHDVLNDDLKQYRLVGPMVFLYRHYLELALKQLTLAAAECLEEDAPKIITHDLVQLWSNLRPLIAKVLGDGGSTFDIIEARLEEISSVDQSSFGFRYPVDKKGKPSRPRATVEVERWKTAIEEIAFAFDAVGTGLYEDQLARSEAYRAQFENSH